MVAWFSVAAFHAENPPSSVPGANLLIAAHARALGLILVTDNGREFSRVPGLVVENWLTEAV